MTTIELDERDTAIIGGGLRASYTSCLDAMAARAGAPHGYNWPRREPTEIDSCIDTLNRIERIACDLGIPSPRSTRREDTIRYWREQSDIWFAEQALKSGNLIG